MARASYVGTPFEFTRLEKRAASAAARAIADGYPDHMPIQMHILSEAKANQTFQKKMNSAAHEVNDLKQKLARRERQLARAETYIIDLKAKVRDLTTMQDVIDRANRFSEILDR